MWHSEDCSQRTAASAAACRTDAQHLAWPQHKLCDMADQMQVRVLEGVEVLSKSIPSLLSSVATALYLHWAQAKVHLRVAEAPLPHETLALWLA